MQLYLSRTQAKKLLGGVRFELKARVELSEEEHELVERYRAYKEVLMKKTVKIPLTGRAMEFDLTIGSLCKGQSFACQEIADILETERVVQEACESFKQYLEVMRSFGGEEIIEFS